MRYLFFQCNGGHLFRGTSCPFDGWTYPGIIEAEAAFAVDDNTSLDRLADLTSADAQLKRRMVIIECQTLPSDLEGICPRSLVSAGVETHDVERDWLAPR